MILNSLSENVEDYLEAILKLSESKGYAQVKELAEELEVKPPSVTGMLIKLKDLGLVNYEKYSAITLTDLGKEFAKKIFKNHNTIKQLLKYLGVPEDAAEKDACAMEHHLDSKTIKQISNFVNFLKSHKTTPDWLVAFKKFCLK